MITDSITAFQTGTYSVSRPPTPTVVAGRRVDGVATTYSIDASVQPVRNGRKLQALIEAHHCTEVRYVLTKSTLETLTPAHGADVVTIDGETWTVVEHSRWKAFGTEWTEAYVARGATP